jgi:MscS family membrane protein
MKSVCHALSPARGPVVLLVLASLIVLSSQPLIARQAEEVEDPGSVGRALLEERLPSFMFDVEIVGVQLWQWIGLALLVLLAALLARIVAAVLRRTLRPLAARTDTPVDDRVLKAMVSPVRLLLGIGLFAVGSASLELPTLAYAVLGRLEVSLAVIAFTWMALRGVDIAVDSFRAHLERGERRAALSILPLGGRTAKAFLLIVAVLAMVQNLGFNVTGLVAGLGVGGLAVALAAQKTIANLFGGVTLVADQPVRVGDFCKFGDGKVGTVEEIGLRSTRVRTLDRTLVTIPNAEFSEVQLENYAARDRMLLLTVLGLRYETSPDQLRHVLAEIRKLLIAHPMVTDSPARVRFVGFGQYSLDLELFAYVATGVWDDFVRVREDVFLRIMDIVQASGTGFAFPSQTLYLGRDGGLDVETTRRAEEEVRSWRERNELPFPDFAEEMVARLDNSVDYPPRGSAVAGPPSAGD